MWLHIRRPRCRTTLLLQLNEGHSIYEGIGAEIIVKSSCSLINLGAVNVRRMDLIIGLKASL